MQQESTNTTVKHTISAAPSAWKNLRKILSGFSNLLLMRVANTRSNRLKGVNQLALLMFVRWIRRCAIQTGRLPKMRYGA